MWRNIRYKTIFKFIGFEDADSIVKEEAEENPEDPDAGEE